MSKWRAGIAAGVRNSLVAVPLLLVAVIAISCIPGCERSLRVGGTSGVCARDAFKAGHIPWPPSYSVNVLVSRESEPTC